MTLIDESLSQEAIDSETNQEQQQQPDPFNNIKQEFGRKLGNVESKVEDLAKANQALLAMLQQTISSPRQEVVNSTTTEDDLEELWYKDPAAAARKIEERATKAIEAKLAKAQEQQSRQNATIQALVRDYPELNDESHPLTKKAIEIYMSMDDADKVSPAAYRLAVKEAAYELGVKPLKKRTDDEIDSFSVSSSLGSSRGSSRRGSGKEELDPKTIAFAQMMGLDVTNPKTIESLKQRAKRSNWNKFQ